MAPSSKQQYLDIPFPASWRRDNCTAQFLLLAVAGQAVSAAPDKIFTSGLVCYAARGEAKANQLMKVTYGPSVTNRPNLQTKATTVLLQLLSYYLNSIHPWHSQQHQNWSDQSPYTDGWSEGVRISLYTYHYHTSATLTDIQSVVRVNPPGGSELSLSRPGSRNTPIGNNSAAPVNVL